MEILMRSNPLQIKRIKKKTKAVFFKDLKEEDMILFSIPVKYVGGNRGRTYASSIKITNLHDISKYTFKTFNEIDKILDCFELLELT